MAMQGAAASDRTAVCGKFPPKAGRGTGGGHVVVCHNKFTVLQTVTARRLGYQSRLCAEGRLPIQTGGDVAADAGFSVHARLQFGGQLPLSKPKPRRDLCTRLSP